MTTKPSFRAGYAKAAGEKTAVSMARWVNTRGEMRTWSEVTTVTVAALVAKVSAQPLHIVAIVTRPAHTIIMRQSTLRSHLAEYDGRHTDVLEHVAIALTEDAGAAHALVELAAKEPHGQIASAATWVLLRLCKDGHAAPLDAAMVMRLRSVLVDADHWETRLHVLQTLDLLDPSPMLTRAQRESFVKAAIHCASDAKPFVAAWALNLLGRLGGEVSAKSQAQIARLIDAANTSGPASTRARLRQLRKSGGLAWFDAIQP